MGQKRKVPEPDGSEIVHESRQSQIYGSNPKPAKKARKSEPAEIKRQAHISSVNAIKKRIRDVTRKLAKAEDMPANVRLEHERALTAYQQELATAEVEKVRQKMIKKYHMVRFLERQKATRLVKKLRKRILECESTEEVEGLKKQMHIAEVDLNYTQYCPLAETYISLYPPKEAGEERLDDQARLDTKSKPPMWKEVEKCMEDGTLDKLRNRKPNVQTKPIKLPELKAPKTQEKAKAKTAAIEEKDMEGLNRRQRRARLFGKSDRDKTKTKNKSAGFLKNQAFGSTHAVQQSRKDNYQEDEQSDGGFFEE
ncbi:hypothetical protein F5884DRAFT_773745 [Xylogone sp. PMI_703]|nr:hypothetical protein F5884DRAFT_773745 [Xylogone sp. PMI_703]